MRTPNAPPRFLVLALALAVPVAASAQGQVYKYKDPAGQTHYSDRAPSDAQQLKAPAAPPAAKPPAASATASPPVTARNAAPPLPVSTSQSAQVQRDVAAARAEQCKQLTDNYDQAVRAQRIIRTNDKGEREYLAGADADNARMQIKAQMDAACGS